MGGQPITEHATGSNGNVAPIALIAGPDTGLSTAAGLGNLPQWITVGPPLPTTTSIRSSANPSAGGDTVTYTATVSPVPDGGNMSFAENGHVISGCGAVALDTTTGVATCSLSYASGGEHAVVASYSGYFSFNSSHSGPLDTVTGTHAGALVIPAGSTSLIDASIDGPVILRAGASVSIEGSHINGPIRSVGAASLALCASHVDGSVLVTNSTGLVAVGSAGDDGAPACAPNTISGAVVLSHNRAGVEVGDNTIAGPLELVANTASSPGTDSAAPEVEANHIGGPLVCSANSPAPTDDTQPNTLGGPAIGQCSGLG